MSARCPYCGRKVPTTITGTLGRHPANPKDRADPLLPPCLGSGTLVPTPEGAVNG